MNKRKHMNNPERFMDDKVIVDAKALNKRLNDFATQQAVSKCDLLEEQGLSGSILHDGRTRYNRFLEQNLDYLSNNYFISYKKAPAILFKKDYIAISNIFNFKYGLGLIRNKKEKEEKAEEYQQVTLNDFLKTLDKKKEIADQAQQKAKEEIDQYQQLVQDTNNEIIKIKTKISELERRADAIDNEIKQLNTLVAKLENDAELIKLLN